MDGETGVTLTDNKSDRRVLEKSFEIIDRRIKNDQPVYGVNTGVGESCRENIPPERVDELPRNLVEFHGCGTGNPFSPHVSLGIVAVRLVTLSQGASGVRVKLLQQLCELINKRIIPVIPEEGSVGASGDLTPLSYLAAVCMGERSVWDGTRKRPTSDVFAEHGLEPLDLRPKESLALMNGTSAMTALTVDCFRRSTYLLRLSATMTGMAVLALDGNPCHFNAEIYELKEHEGQAKVAELIRRALDLEDDENGSHSRETFEQDRYSLRCVPQILGVLADAVPLMKKQLETEVNGVDDNPLVDVENEEVLHGGNFYGGHVAFVADTLKNTLANMADLMDRQLAHLVDPKMNRGLPSNLTGADEENISVNHGFKAVQIASSSWAAEAQKMASPGSVFSRTTESHNQDKVSMGSISSRDARRILDLTEKTVATNLMALVQALDLRMKQDELSPGALPDSLEELRASIRNEVDFLDRDRPLDEDIETVLDLIRNRELPVEGSVRFSE